MSYCRLEDAGVYRATLEAMLFGTVTEEAEDQRFNDSVLKKKAENVNDLVKRFEKNLKLEDETVVDKESEVAEEVQAKLEAEDKVQPIKPRSRIPSMEEFIDGILRASSPIPQAQLEKEAPVQLEETPILQHHPVRRELNFGIPNTTMSYRLTPGCAKIAEAKSSTTPRTKTTILKESPDSAYYSAGSSTSTAVATPSTPQDKEEELDIYLKLGRAQLHEQIKTYSAWDAQHLRSIATKVSTMRLSALKKAALDCPTTQLMIQIYEKCATGTVNKELDTIVVSIFHLLDEQVHVERISVLEEYVVLKYCKKTMH